MSRDIDAAVGPDAPGGDQSVRPVDVERVGSEGAATDRVAVEAPLQIMLDGQPFAVVMRTPGDDAALAAGFLFAERIVGADADIVDLQGALDAGGSGTGVVNVTLVASAAARATGKRRTVSSASCGVCGRETLDALMDDLPTVTSDWTMAAATLSTLPDILRRSQRIFEVTGGVHAAAVCSNDGGLIDIAEDVGRHNAVDKVVGRALMTRRLPLDRHVLCVSGRTSYEIVQKALLAGFPVVVAVSAPSSLAVDLAHRFGLTLIGFARGDQLSIYTHPGRVARGGH